MGVLDRVIPCSGVASADDSVLKVSHHGSRTGTGSNLLNMLNPNNAFISAGNSKRYKHPHSACTTLLKKYGVQTVVSKKVKQTVEYRANGRYITRHFY